MLLVQCAQVNGDQPLYRISTLEVKASIPSQKKDGRQTFSKCKNNAAVDRIFEKDGDWVVRKKLQYKEIE